MGYVYDIIYHYIKNQTDVLPFARNVFVSSYLIHFTRQFFFKFSYCNFLYIISGVNNEKKIPLITYPPNVSKKNDTMPQLDETPFRAEQLTKENDQCESGHIEISESGTI